MTNHATFSIVLATLVAAGCGASSGLRSSSGTTAGTTTSVGSVGAGGSSGSTTVTTGNGGAGGSVGSATGTTGTTGNGGGGGAYTLCAEGYEAANGAVYLGGVGIQGGAYLTVTPGGGMLATTFTNLNGHQSSFTFDQTTGTSAVLGPGGGALTDCTGMCVYGPGDFETFPATLTATAGALEYTGGTVFVAVNGTLAPSNPGACSSATEPGNGYIVCSGGDGFPPAPTDPGAPVPDFAVGTYTCISGIGTYDLTGGVKDYASGGGTTGTLVVTQSGAKVTAAYTGDMYVSGTLDFTIATPTSAHADPDQTLLAQCLVPINLMGPPSPSTVVPEPLAVGAGALVSLDETTLFLMLSGTMTGTPEMASTCPGAVKMGSLICTRQ